MDQLFVRIIQIVQLWLCDYDLVRNWAQMYDAMELKGDRISLEKMWNGNQETTYSFVFRILQLWVSENGNNATLEALENILRQENFNWSADAIKALRNKNPGKQIVVTLNTDVGCDGINLAPYFDENDRYIGPKISSQPGPVTILRLSKESATPSSRVVIYVDYLLHMLDKVKDLPVVLISINGKQRSGKSFMLNNLVKYLVHGFGNQENTWLDLKLESSFAWNGNVDRCTSGIQVWSEPIQVDLGSKKVAVILMDTQGLFDNKTSSQENAVIFAFSVLLSSVFVFNVKDTADDALEYLRTFLEFARFAASREDSGCTRELKFQHLIILLRDWQAQHEFKCGYYDDRIRPDGQPLNLKTKYLSGESMHQESVERRQAITNFFEEIGLFCMPHPNNTLLDPPNDTRSSSWNTAFRSYAIEFVRHVASANVLEKSTKKIFGEEITAGELKVFVKKWAELIMESDGLIKNKPIFDTTVEIFYTGRIGVLVQEYKASMQNVTQNYPRGLPDARFEAEHQRFHDIATQKFTKLGDYGGKAYQAQYQAALLLALQEEKQRIEETNKSNLLAEKRRIEAEQNKIAAEKAKIEAEKNKIAAEKPQKEKDVAKQFAVSESEKKLNQVTCELHEAYGRRQNVHENRYNYKSEVQVEKKKRTKVLGFNGHPIRYTVTEHHYDEELFQRTLASVEQTVRNLEIQKAAEEQALWLAKQL